MPRSSPSPANLLVKGSARVLRAGSGPFRLGVPAAGAAANARRRRYARRLGRGHGDLPGADVPGQGQSRAAARWSADSWRPVHMTWVRVPGPRWPRSLPTDWACNSSTSSSVPGRRICRMRASPAGPLTRRRPAWQSTRREPMSSPSWRHSLRVTSDLRCSVPAMSACSHAMAGSTDATMKAAATVIGTFLRAPVWPRSRVEGSERRRSGVAIGLRHARAWCRVRRGQGRPAAGQIRVTRLVGAFAAGPSSIREWFAANFMAV